MTRTPKETDRLISWWEGTDEATRTALRNNNMQPPTQRIAESMVKAGIILTSTQWQGADPSPLTLDASSAETLNIVDALGRLGKHYRDEIG